MAPADNKANPVESEEDTMRKSSKARSGNGKSRHKASNGVRAESKTALVARLLKRTSGCTSADVLKKTGWPTVSMPAMAKAAKLKLKKEKEEGKPTRYYGS